MLVVKPLLGKIYIKLDVLNLFDIEDIVKECKGYHKIGMLYYLKLYEGICNTWILISV
jgi:hypothetical protein